MTDERYQLDGTRIIDTRRKERVEFLLERTAMLAFDRLVGDDLERHRLRWKRIPKEER